MWVIRRKDNVGKAVLSDETGSCQRHSWKKRRLVFHRYDDLYFLSEFWTPGSNTGREIQISDREKALEKALAVKRQDHVLIDRGK